MIIKNCRFEMTTAGNLMRIESPFAGVVYDTEARFRVNSPYGYRVYIPSTTGKTSQNEQDFSNLCEVLNWADLWQWVHQHDNAYQWYSIKVTYTSVTTHNSQAMVRVSPDAGIKVWLPMQSAFSRFTPNAPLPGEAYSVQTHNIDIHSGAPARMDISYRDEDLTWRQAEPLIPSTQIGSLSGLTLSFPGGTSDLWDDIKQTVIAQEDYVTYPNYSALVAYPSILGDIDNWGDIDFSLSSLSALTPYASIAEAVFRSTELEISIDDSLNGWRPFGTLGKIEGSYERYYSVTGYGKVWRTAFSDVHSGNMDVKRGIDPLWDRVPMIAHVTGSFKTDDRQQTTVVWTDYWLRQYGNSSGPFDPTGMYVSGEWGHDANGFPIDLPAPLPRVDWGKITEAFPQMGVRYRFHFDGFFDSNVKSDNKYVLQINGKTIEFYDDDWVAHPTEYRAYQQTKDGITAFIYITPTNIVAGQGYLGLGFFDVSYDFDNAPYTYDDSSLQITQPTIQRVADGAAYPPIAFGILPPIIDTRMINSETNIIAVEEETRGEIEGYRVQFEIIVQGFVAATRGVDCGIAVIGTVQRNAFNEIIGVDAIDFGENDKATYLDSFWIAKTGDSKRADWHITAFSLYRIEHDIIFIDPAESRQELYTSVSFGRNFTSDEIQQYVPRPKVRTVSMRPDYDGVSHYVCNTETGMEIGQVRHPLAVREVKNNLATYEDGVCYLGDSVSTFFVMARHKEIEKYFLLVSHDYGRTFESAMPTPFDESFICVRANSMEWGGHIAAGVTEEGAIYFSRSNDGIHWKPPSLVTTMAGVSEVDIYSHYQSGSGEIFICNPSYFMAKTDDYGRTWQVQL